MSNQSQIQRTDLQETKEFSSLFLEYLECSLNDETWFDLENDFQFRELRGLVPKYKNAVFQHLVNFIAVKHDIQVNTLIEDFTEFTRNIS